MGDEPQAVLRGEMIEQLDGCARQSGGRDGLSGGFGQ
jgi:hypothetical protein